MENMSGFPSAVFIGRTNTGKSFAIRDLLYHKRHFKYPFVASGSESVNHFYSKHIPEVFIDDHFDAKTTTKFMERQKERINALRAKNPDMSMEKVLEKCSSIFILDDLMFDVKKWGTSKEVYEMMFNGRHSGLMMIIAIQYCLGIKPALRNQARFIFIFNTPSMEERTRIHEHWCRNIPFDIFNKLMNIYTKNYGCLVIDNSIKDASNTDPTRAWMDSVFYYKAEAHDDFKLCPQEVWKLSEKIKNKNSIDPSRFILN